MIRMITLAALIVLAFPASLAQLGQAARRPTIATVRFTSSQRGNPSYYSLAVTSMGSASYRSIPNTDRRTGKPYTMQFVVSATTRRTIFQLARRLHLLRGDFRTIYPITWTKSLTFTDGPTHNQIFYTKSKKRSLNRLTRLFETISGTLEFGRRLQGPACWPSRQTGIRIVADGTTIEARTFVRSASNCSTTENNRIRFRHSQNCPPICWRHSETIQAECVPRLIVERAEKRK
jgi:hypothetical protein